MVDTIKFSEFTNGGDMPNNTVTVGPGSSDNTKYNNPWTFLAPGSTGSRPVPAASMYYRLRLNTTLNVYEYYDPISLTWTQLSGTGTGTVNPGVTNNLAFYAANGTAVSPLSNLNNAVLGTNGSGVPALTTTLPTGLTIPGAIITGSTAALTAGSVVAAPVAGTDLTNKTYVDALVGAGVTSITGTTNQVIASAPTGAVTLSLPQNIATGSTPTFAGLTLASIPLGATSGGTGVNNTGTWTNAGNVAFAGSFTFTGTLTGNTGVTFPTSGTLATTAQLPVAAALTKTDDTNVTLTLGGTPATALLQATSLTLGWTGVLSGTRGGTGVNNGANTLTMAGSHVLSGAFTSTFTFTNTTSVTFPTSGTLATTAQLPTPAALTKVDDTNVTLTLGGTPATALLQATSLTLGWTGQLAVSRGGTGISSFGTGVATALGQNVQGSGGIALATTTTYTPALAFGGASVGITYSTQAGFYTRVGDVVTVCVDIALSSKGSSVGSATITLPVAGRTGALQAVSFLPENITFTGTPFLTIASGATTASLVAAATGVGTAAMTNTGFTNTSDFFFTISYLV